VILHDQTVTHINITHHTRARARTHTHTHTIGQTNEYFTVLKAQTKHALQQVWARWRVSPNAATAKMVSYFDGRPARQK
jgi:hypothetical protein